MTPYVASIAQRLRTGLLALAVLPVLLCLAARPAAACQIAVVLSADLRPYREVLQGLRATVPCSVHEVRLRDGDTIERVRRLSPGVVVAIGTDAFRVLRPFRGVPLVHVMVIPAEAARDDGTRRSGISMDIAPSAWLRAIRRLFPAARRVGILSDPAHTGAFVAEALRAAPAAGLDLVIRRVEGPDDVPQVLAGMQDDIDVFWLLPDPAVAAPPMVEHLLHFSIERRIPIVAFSRRYLDLGAVASLDVDPREMGAQAGELTAALVRHGRDGGIRYARHPHLSINRAAAHKLGVALGRDAVEGEVGDAD